MKFCHWQSTVFCVPFLALGASAATHCVDLNCANPVPPFSNWSTAATNIQNAVDAATNGDLILVTNGIYQTGEKAASGMDRVAVTNAVTVESVNGPAMTWITGSWDPQTNGPAAIRCVFLASNAVLIGFTLTNGACSSSPPDGGGVLCQSTASVLSNCVLAGNAARIGGGAYFGTLNNCILSNNVAQFRGGGGGVCTLNNCLLTGNSAPEGGAVTSLEAMTVILNNCTLYGNSASEDGGGFYSIGLGAPAYLYATNCIIFGNTAPSDPNYTAGLGEGTFSCCCTAPLPAGGVEDFTNDPDFVNAATGDFHLQSNSPCINAGPTWAVSATDLDGNPRIVGGFVDIGAYEHQLPAPPAVVPSFQATYPGVATGIVVGFTGQVTGHPTASSWNFGDGTVISNQLPNVSHSWLAPGDYDVTLTGYSVGYPTGVTATVVIHVLINPIHYVSQNGVNPVAPYFTWATAATNIQDAVDAAYAGGTVLVTNGIYTAGGDVNYAGEGLVMNRVYVTKPIALLSVNGPAGTVIQGNTGNGAVRCVYLSEGDFLSGFTLTNGLTSTNDNSANDVSVQSGGGVYSAAGDAVISNCVLTANIADYIGGAADGGSLINCLIMNNSAYAGGGASGTLENCLIISNSAGIGGGTYGGTVSDCVIVRNSATYSGGGAYWSTLDNCTVANNFAAESGGGVFGTTINNCIVYYNSSPDGANYLTDSFTGYGAYSNSCTTPLPGGPGNITNEPAFVNLAADDFHLQSNSPCINSGNNAWVLVPTDFDGNPRIVGGTVDMGAYEYQTPASMTSFAWLQQYGLPITTNTDTSDHNGSGLDVYQDWIAGLNPTNPASILALLTPGAINNANGITVSWHSVSGISYVLQRSTNLFVFPAFLTIQSGIPGQTGTTSYTDTTATNSVPYFYRVGAQ